MNENRLAPAGLGGWLWPVTWSVAALPLLLTASITTALISGLMIILRYGEVPYAIREPWAQREIGVMLLLTTSAWWFAIRWFAHDPRMPRQGPMVLLTCAGVVETIAWIDRDYAEYHVLASILLGVTIASLIGARWSARVHNTFVHHPLPTPAPGWRGTVISGPRDWSHRRWLLPGALAYALIRLWFELPTFAEAAFETIPPPLPGGNAYRGNGNAAALVALGHPGRYIEASRVALVLSSVAVLMLAGALIGMVRGARWTLWITLSTLLVAMTAPLWMSIRDWCCPFLDGPEFGRMWQGWCVVLLITTLCRSLRRWPEAHLRMEQ